MILRWKQIGDDYELRCPCCRQPISMIYKRNGRFFAQISIDGHWKSEEGKSFKAIRVLVNKRVEELIDRHVKELAR